MLGISEKTLFRMRKNKQISYHEIRGKILYGVQDLKEFVESTKQESTIELNKHIFQEENAVLAKLMHIKDIDKYLRHLETLKKNLKNGGNEKMIKGSAIYENLPTQKSLNLGFGGYELNTRNKERISYRIYWYDENEAGKRVKYTETVPHATCPQEAYIALEFRRIELFKKWLFKGQINQPQTVLNSGTIQTQQENIPTNGNCPKFKDFVEWYMENNPQRKSKNTLASQKSTIKKHFIPYFGSYRLNEIDRVFVDGFFTEQGKIEIKGQKITQKTIKNRYSILQALFNEAIEQEHIIKNPVSRKKGQKPYKILKEKKRVWTDEEFQKVYDNAVDHLKPQLICYWNTGMRKMEVLNLQVKDIDFETKFITLQAEDAKSTKFRDIPINAELMVVLKEMVESKNPDDYVFTYYGKRIKNNHGAFISAIKEAGLEGKRKLHDLRHTFGTRLMRNGTPDKVAQEILGHADSAMLHQYQHPNKEDKLEAVNGQNGGK